MGSGGPCSDLNAMHVPVRQMTLHMCGKPKISELENHRFRLVFAPCPCNSTR